MKNEKAVEKIFISACQDWNLGDGTLSIMYQDFIKNLESQGYKIIKD